MANEAYMKWRRSINNKMPYHGEIDYKKKKIVINKKRAKSKPTFKRPVRKGASKYPEVFDTIYHEETHRKHPKMHEKTVRRKTREAAKTFPTKKKRAYYALYA